ncbi:MAG: hypothetical protein IJO99_02765 [Ruminococcus sp.]|nr:hypothetical protein [Ruminococcus sp.]
MQSTEELREALRKSNAPFTDSRSADEKALYSQQQADNRRMRADRSQFERYRARLGDDAPKTFSQFRKLKKQGGEKWEDLQKLYRSKFPKSVDKSGESGIINKKLSDRIYNIHNDTEYGVFRNEDIENNMASSHIGRQTMRYIENEGLTVEMNYDPNQSDDVDGYIIGKNIVINATRHVDVNHVSETIIHETAHRQFSWCETQEDEINCRIYEYLHSHETISNSKIREIVDFVRVNYANLPKGDLYGY